MFTSKRTKRFRALLDALSIDALRQARAAYRLFTRNPRHASLQFKRISPPIRRSIRRALATITG